MDKISPLAIALISVFGVRAQDKAPFWSADLNQIRQTARTIPGWNVPRQSLSDAPARIADSSSARACLLLMGAMARS